VNSLKKNENKKVTTVHAHPLHVPINEKNPTGITIRDQHLRRISGSGIGRDEIYSTFKNYDRTSIIFPTKNKLPYKNSDKYDDLIAVWTDFFNKKFTAKPPLDPDVVKALLASESKFVENPSGSTKGIGIAQITTETLEALQNPKSETSEFTFYDIRKKDLKCPDIAIPMAIRWLYRKRRLAEGKLGHAPNPEELILEYKGLLKSQTPFKNSALKNFREDYARLKE
jgi:hypothetical protein